MDGGNAEDTLEKFRITFLPTHIKSYIFFQEEEVSDHFSL